MSAYTFSKKEQSAGVGSTEKVRQPGVSSCPPLSHPKGTPVLMICSQFTLSRQNLFECLLSMLMYSAVKLYKILCDYEHSVELYYKV